MKQWIMILIASVAILANVTSCRELPTDKALDHQWRMVSVEYADGTVADPGERYYCFYRHTAELTSWGAINYVANMEQTDNLIKLSFPDQDPRYLKYWGIVVPEELDTDFTVVFEVRKLTSSTLILEDLSCGTVLTMRKF